MASTVTLPKQRGFGETTRTDAWWMQPLAVFLGFSAFIVYSTWAAFQGTDTDPLLLLVSAGTGRTISRRFIRRSCSARRRTPGFFGTLPVVVAGAGCLFRPRF